MMRRKNVSLWWAWLFLIGVSMSFGWVAYAQEEGDDTEETEDDDEEEDDEDDEEDEDDDEEGGDEDAEGDEDSDGPNTPDDEREQDEDELMDDDEEEEECTPLDYEELKLLADLRKRDNELQKMAKLLEEKEAVLARVQDQLDQRMAAMMVKLQELEGKLTLGEAAREAREQRVQKLIETLKTLSARKAAPILAKADSRFATRLLLGLGPQRTGKLLAAMEPAQAARIMSRLANAKTPAQRAAAKQK